MTKYTANDCLHLNLSKTKEMVFRQPRITYFRLPPAVGDIEQVNCRKLLGVIFQSNFKMDSHQHLQHQGMSGEQLSVVTYSIIVSRILYALPAWGWFLSAELTSKINAPFRRLKRFGYMTCNITVSDLIDTSGHDLFCKLCSSQHSLHHLLLPERKYSKLRNRGHPYELPEYCTNLHKKSFIIQSLYLYIYFF